MGSREPALALLSLSTLAATLGVILLLILIAARQSQYAENLDRSLKAEYEARKVAEEEKKVAEGEKKVAEEQTWNARRSERQAGRPPVRVRSEASRPVLETGLYPQHPRPLPARLTTRPEPPRTIVRHSAGSDLWRACRSRTT